MDRRETYTREFRDWHWRVSLEELVWGWRDDPSVQDFRARVLLGAGAADDIWPAQIYRNARDLAVQLDHVDGDTFFVAGTGHSAHAERPKWLAARILDFFAAAPFRDWSVMMQPAVSLLLSESRRTKPPLRHPPSRHPR